MGAAAVAQRSKLQMHEFKEIGARKAGVVLIESTGLLSEDEFENNRDTSDGA